MQLINNKWIQYISKNLVLNIDAKLLKCKNDIKVQNMNMVYDYNTWKMDKQNGKIVNESNIYMRNEW